MAKFDAVRQVVLETIEGEEVWLGEWSAVHRALFLPEGTLDFPVAGATVETPPPGRIRIFYDPDVNSFRFRDEAGDEFAVDGTRWADLRFPLTRDKQGQVQKPDYDFANNGLLFPQANATEIVYLIAQLDHAYKLESELRPHVHFVQDVAQQPTFKIDYRWFKNGEDPTVGFTTISATVFLFEWTSGSIAQIASFPAIDGSGIDTVSSILDIKLYRDDSSVIGDVLAKEFDIHYLKDSRGSPWEFDK